MRNKLLLLGAGFALIAAPAFAHVTLVEKTAKPGSAFTANFHIGHGCGDKSPTTMLSVTMPAGVSGASGKAPAGWTLKTAGKTLIWTGINKNAPITENFPVSMKLPNTEGALYFDVVQTCEVGEEKWVERPQGGTKLTRPAPELMVTNNPPPVKAAAATISQAWIRYLPAGLPAAGYFTIRNTGTKALSLTGAASPACGTLMLHQSEDKGGLSTMASMASVDIAAGKSVSFAPTGYHLMCENPKPALKIGAQVPVTLQFADGSAATAQFSVRNAAGK